MRISELITQLQDALTSYGEMGVQVDTLDDYVPVTTAVTLDTLYERNDGEGNSLLLVTEDPTACADEEGLNAMALALLDDGVEPDTLRHWLEEALSDHEAIVAAEEEKVPR